MSITEPKLLCTNHASMILTLSKRRLVTTYSLLFEERDYHVWDLNFAEPEYSDYAYDPLQYINDWTDVKYLAEAIVMSDSRKQHATADPYWDMSAISLLSALIAMVKGISVIMMLQSESQLKAMYGEQDAKTIIN